MIKKYRSKPRVIEALQLLWSTWEEMCDFVGVGSLSDGNPVGCYIGEDGRPMPEEHTSNTMGLLIPTKEGLEVALEGDFIIKGINGELYPCKPDIFENTYEALRETEDLADHFIKNASNKDFKKVLRWYDEKYDPC